ncbi:MAG TPA: superoxide dismutase family protein [Vicinamibacterales bacterium]|nr:superoxide dismutase family protein [Vicinamibacterales bacterium]
MRNAKAIAVAMVLSVATCFAAAQGQAPTAPAGVQGAGQGTTGGGGGQTPAAPARGVTVNQTIVQKATAKITGGDTISGTVEFNEYHVSNGGLIQIVYNLQGLPQGMHGVHVHSVGRCEPPFASANGHFDPGPAGNTDADLNHPFHAGDLPNIVANATGAVTATNYTTRFNLGGPLSPFDADGAALVIHQYPDTYQTGTKGQGVGGGNPIACGVIVKQ